ncbi:unnamed protein product [Linum trigynum]|uniref:TF-B3 domain-containing protein n=1 Tax=Linum trigynum TaxID=586398 RepID=A0AAV2D514_9ROSI
MAGGAHSKRRTATRPRFSQLIMPGMVRDRQLAVPKLFAKEYGDGLSNRVVFELPNGAEWPIRLSGSGDKLWFSQGWRQFADFHCVNSTGYFLMFEYLGRSSFRVFVFDPSASEISYPPSEADVSSESGGQEEDLPSESSQGDVEGCTAGKFKRVIGRPKPFLGSGSSAGGNGGVWRRTLSAGLPEKGVSRTNMHSSKLRTKSGRQPTIFGSSSETAVPFTAGNPSFEVTVAPGHLPVSRNCKVRMPTGFASNVEEDICEVELWVQGSHWPVTLNREVQKGNDYISLGGGWRAFAAENSLDEGDVCVFKLIATKEDGFRKSMKFKVNIFRGE